MEKLIKAFSLMLVVVLVVACFSACGSAKSKIVGKWERDASPSLFGTRLGELEFFKDGTYASDDVNYHGNYTIDGNRIKLTGVLVEAIVCDFEIDGDKLIMYYAEDDIWEFEKSR